MIPSLEPVSTVSSSRVSSVSTECGCPATFQNKANTVKVNREKIADFLLQRILSARLFVRPDVTGKRADRSTNPPPGLVGIGTDTWRDSVR